MSEDLLVTIGAGLRFTVPHSYGCADEIDGRTYWTNFADAVKAAQSTIQRIEMPLGIQDHDTRAFVDLRINATACEKTLIRFEVYRDRVVVVPTSQGGLSDEQKATALGVKLQFLDYLMVK